MGGEYQAELCRCGGCDGATLMKNLEGSTSMTWEENIKELTVYKDKKPGWARQQSNDERDSKAMMSKTAKPWQSRRRSMTSKTAKPWGARRWNQDEQDGKVMRSETVKPWRARWKSRDERDGKKRDGESRTSETVKPGRVRQQSQDEQDSEGKTSETAKQRLPRRGRQDEQDGEAKTTETEKPRRPRQQSQDNRDGKAGHSSLCLLSRFGGTWTRLQGRDENKTRQPSELGSAKRQKWDGEAKTSKTAKPRHTRQRKAWMSKTAKPWRVRQQSHDKREGKGKGSSLLHKRMMHNWSVWKDSIQRGDLKNTNQRQAIPI